MTWAAGLALLRRFWPAIPIVALAAMALLFRVQRDDARHTLTNERSAWTASVEQADRRRAEQERGFAQQIASATSAFADRLAAREPLILRSTNTVREYAQTDAGRVLCRTADRVRGIDALDADLVDPDPRAAGGSAAAVPPDDTASTSRR